jgi:microcystin-dependent protein
MNVNNTLPPRPQVPSPSPIPVHYVGMPPGSVIAFAGEIRSLGESGSNKTNLPMFNWLLCDGRKVKVAEYPALFAALGHRYGGSGGRFNLPDYQGTFLRGVGKDDASVDNRKGPKHGHENSVGSTQGDAMLSHKHKYKRPKVGTIVPAIPPEGGIHASYLVTNKTSTPIITEKRSHSSVSQIETRPTNTFVYWLIKSQLD